MRAFKLILTWLAQVLNANFNTIIKKETIAASII